MDSVPCMNIGTELSSSLLPDHPKPVNERERMARLRGRERELAAYMLMERALQQFLKRWTRPRQQWPGLTAGLEEVGRERLLLAAEMDDENGVSLRRQKMGG